MTEAEWHNGIHAIGMLLFQRERASQRQVLLFNIACCRRVWNLLTDEDRKAVDEFEMSSDDSVAVAGLEERYSPPPIRYRTFHSENGGVAVLPEFEGQPEPGTDLCTRLAARGWSIGGVAHETQKLAAGNTPRGIVIGAACEEAERRGQSLLLRDIFGNPFRPVAFSPELRTTTAVAIAQQMYESRDFSAMPILADALQDAGCDNDDILNHCRDANATHVRGCWVVDLVLGKE